MPRLKTALLVSIFLIPLVPIFAQVHEGMGLANVFEVEAGGHMFEIRSAATFDVRSAGFSLEEKTITLNLVAHIEENLGEFVVPKKLLDGQIDLLFGDTVHDTIIYDNRDVWFITIKFNGTGAHSIKITGTESVDTDVPEIGNMTVPVDSAVPMEQNMTESGSSGCLIATAAYGSEMSPQVQRLREMRDYTILETESGAVFMSGFNKLYYSFSPTISDWQRHSPAFNEIIKVAITPMLSSLAILDHADIDSELEMIGYGTGVIALNLAMYMGPAIILARKCRLFGKQ